MPQPMSTPTAAGMIASRVGQHRADRRALAEVRVGHQRDVRCTNGSEAVFSACRRVTSSRMLAQFSSLSERRSTSGESAVHGASGRPDIGSARYRGPCPRAAGTGTLLQRLTRLGATGRGPERTPVTGSRPAVQDRAPRPDRRRPPDDADGADRDVRGRGRADGRRRVRGRVRRSVEATARLSPDVVCMDVSMPTMDGAGGDRGAPRRPGRRPDRHVHRSPGAARRGGRGRRRTRAQDAPGPTRCCTASARSPTARPTARTASDGVQPRLSSRSTNGSRAVCGLGVDVDEQTVATRNSGTRTAFSTTRRSGSGSSLSRQR